MRAKLVTILLLAATGFPLGGATITDNFDDNSLNPWLWSVSFPFGGPGSVLEVNQRLEVTSLVAAVVSLDGIVEGDFDLQVSFTLLTDLGSLPPEAEGDVGVGILWLFQNPGSGCFGIGMRNYGGDCNEAPYFPGVPTSDQSGRLRVARVGSTYFGYYWAASDWAPAGTISNPNTGPTDIHLFTAGGEGFTVAAAFDDFQLQADRFSPTGVPEPGTFALAAIALGLLWRVAKTSAAR